MQNTQADASAREAEQAWRHAKQLEQANEGLGLTEKVRKFVLAPQAFTVENGQMTPTLKVRRHAVIREYRDALDALYS